MSKLRYLLVIDRLGVTHPIEADDDMGAEMEAQELLSHIANVEHQEPVLYKPIKEWKESTA